MMLHLKVELEQTMFLDAYEIQPRLKWWIGVNTHPVGLIIEDQFPFNHLIKHPLAFWPIHSKFMQTDSALRILTSDRPRTTETRLRPTPVRL